MKRRKALQRAAAVAAPWRGFMQLAPTVPVVVDRFYIDPVDRGLVASLARPGSRPLDLPVEQVSKFKLGVNLATARTLGIVLPPSLVLRADEVVE